MHEPVWNLKHTPPPAELSRGFVQSLLAHQTYALNDILAASYGDDAAMRLLRELCAGRVGSVEERAVQVDPKALRPRRLRRHW